MTSDQGNRMLLLIALPIEAKPFINELGLVQCGERDGLCYESEDFRLVVTGVGPSKATASAKRALCSEKPIAVCNIGMCGSRSKDINLGEIIYANPIYDYTLGKKYYPDPLVHHGFREEGLVTCDRPQLVRDAITVDGALIVDMEAANICKVVKTSVPLHQVQILKIVSDYLDDKFLKKKFVVDLVMRNITDILTYVYKLKKVAYDLPVFTNSAMNKYKVYSSELRLTETQQQKFKRLCLHRIAMGDISLCVLDSYDVDLYMSKSDQKILFVRICNELIS